MIRTGDTGHPLTVVGRILNHSPSGRNGPLTVYNIHHSIRSQLGWTDSWRKSLARSWPVPVDSGQVWVSANIVYGVGPHPYGKVVWFDEQSSGSTTRCAYIGSSREQSWFWEVVLWSRLRGSISVQLIVGPCKGYALRTLKLFLSFFNYTNYQVIL